MPESRGQCRPFQHFLRLPKLQALPAERLLQANIIAVHLPDDVRENMLGLPRRPNLQNFRALPLQLLLGLFPAKPASQAGELPHARQQPPLLPALQGNFAILP